MLIVRSEAANQLFFILLPIVSLALRSHTTRSRSPVFLLLSFVFRQSNSGFKFIPFALPFPPPSNSPSPPLLLLPTRVIEDLQFQILSIFRTLSPSPSLLLKLFLHRMYTGFFDWDIETVSPSLAREGRPKMKLKNSSEEARVTGSS